MEQLSHLQGGNSRLQFYLNYQYPRFDSLSHNSRSRQATVIGRRRLLTGGVAAVGGVAEGVDVEAMEARGKAREPSPHLGVP